MNFNQVIEEEVVMTILFICLSVCALNCHLKTRAYNRPIRVIYYRILPTESITFGIEKPQARQLFARSLSGFTQSFLSCAQSRIRSMESCSRSFLSAAIYVFSWHLFRFYHLGYEVCRDSWSKEIIMRWAIVRDILRVSWSDQTLSTNPPTQLSLQKGLG